MIRALLLIALLASSAWGADFGCGRDTDRNGTVDNLCPGSDQDFDGYTVAQGDCDDGDWSIRPGVPTGKGCSAGQWRMCKADGTGYTSCTAAQFDPTTADNQLHTDRTYDTVIYVDVVSGNNSTGNGSFANPYQTLEKVSTGGTGAVTINDGTVIVLRGGTYGTWGASARGFYQTAQCATKGCAIMAYPGETAIVNKTSTTESTVVEISNPNPDSKWTVFGLEVDSDDVGEGVGIGFWDSGSGHRAINNYVHNIDGIQDDNLSGIRCYQGARCDITHNYVADVCDTGEGSCVAGNTGGIECQSTACQMNYNIVKANTRFAWGVRWKHANNTETRADVIGNYIEGTADGIKAHGRNVYVTANLISVDSAADSSSGTCLNNGLTDPNHYIGPVFFSYNTCLNVQTGLLLYPTRYKNSDGSTASDGCSGTYNEGVSEFQKNVFSSAATVHNINNGIISVDPYGSDLNRAYFLPSKFDIDENCYWNSTLTADAFREYSANDANLTCSGRGNNGGSYTFANWKAAFPSFDATSFYKDPSLNGIYKATDTDCDDKGYIAYLDLSPAPTPIPGGGFVAYLQ